MSPQLNPLKYETWLYGSSIEADMRIGPGKGAQRDIFSFIIVFLFWSWVSSPLAATHHHLFLTLHPHPVIILFYFLPSVLSLTLLLKFDCGYDTTVTPFKSAEVCSNRNWANDFMNVCVFELTSVLQCFSSKSLAFKNSGPLLKNPE